MTRVFEKQKQIEARLLAVGADAPMQQARLVLEHCLCLAPMTLALEKQSALDVQKEAAIDDMVSRLCAGEPLQYVLGTQPFLDLTLRVRRGVLIPRTETEELALFAIEAAKKKAHARVLDLCTGSGALALALKHRVPNAEVVASDVSDEALAVARENAQMLALDVLFVQSDLFDRIEGTFDLIVSNPPYIRSADCKHLSRTVRDHEPMLALDGGADGLYFYRAIAAQAGAHLTSGGVLMLETGFDQAHQTACLLEKDFEDIRIMRDMQGVQRMVLARKKGGEAL